MNDNTNDYSKAITDFQNARRRADVQQLFAQLRGNSAHLFSYDDIRKKLKAVETGRIERREIPLDAIVGSVGRYNDFTHNFLPKLDSDEGRWAGVKTEVLGLTGVPPIEVYQIDQAYFVRDGNHRVSIARQMNLETIEAYVTKVNTKVPLSPDVSLDDLLIKSEYADFLEETDLKHYFKDAEIEVTAPGRYDRLLEHIQLHQYYMGLKLKRDIDYKEAVQDWYSEIYVPTVKHIQSNNLLAGFEGRTEADLYLWMANWHGQLEKRLGWKLDVDSVAEGLRDELNLSEGSKESYKSIELLLAAEQDVSSATQLFGHVMVAVTGNEAGWLAVDQAIVLAKLEGSKLYGLHGVGPNPDDTRFSAKKKIRRGFLKRCKDAGVKAQFTFVRGDVAVEIAERSRWMDLVIAPLSYPPQGFSLAKLEGYERLLRQSYRPVLSVPTSVTDSLTNSVAASASAQTLSLSQFKKPLFAFDGTPSNLVALSVVAYISKAWDAPLKIVHVVASESGSSYELFSKAQEYLRSRHVEVDAEIIVGDVVSTISHLLVDGKHDLLVTGSYAYRRWALRNVPDMMTGVMQGAVQGVLNNILQSTDVPVLVVK